MRLASKYQVTVIRFEQYIHACIECELWNRWQGPFSIVLYHFFLPRKHFLDIFDNIRDLHSHVSMCVSISYRTSVHGDFIKISPLEDQQKHKCHCVILLSK